MMFMYCHMIGNLFVAEDVEKLTTADAREEDVVMAHQIIKSLSVRSANLEISVKARAGNMNANNSEAGNLVNTTIL